MFRSAQFYTVFSRGAAIVERAFCCGTVPYHIETMNTPNKLSWFK